MCSKSTRKRQKNILISQKLMKSRKRIKGLKTKIKKRKARRSKNGVGLREKK